MIGIEKLKQVIAVIIVGLSGFLKLFNSYFDHDLNKAQPIEKLKIPKNLNEKEIGLI